MHKKWIKPKNNLAIEIQDLSKTYINSQKKIHALSNINLNIKCGSFYGLLGPNGAGKSTIINILGGTTTKDTGKIKIWGLNIDTHRKQSKLAIGIVPQELNIDAFFTPKDQLELQAGLFNVPKKQRVTDYILELMELTEKANSYSRNLSGGMRRRLLVAKAMVHNPPIIILDEPTAGVDIELRKKLWDNFKKLNKEGITIILTTHYLEEAEILCDEIAIIHKGEIVANDNKKNLLKLIDKKILIIKFEDSPNKTLINALSRFGETKILKKVCQITFKPTKVSIDKILKVTKNHGLTILDLQTKDANLEDVFISLTQN